MPALGIEADWAQSIVGTMALAMSRPWKHPKTGVYWLRKGIPEVLREAVGKREEKLSLITPLLSRPNAKVSELGGSSTKLRQG